MDYDKLDKLGEAAAREIEAASDIKLLEKTRIKYLGRKGELTAQLRLLKEMTLEEKQEMGPRLNKLKSKLQQAVDVRIQELISGGGGGDFKVDVTMPGKKVIVGHLHPLTRIENEIKDIFRSMNFSVVEGPEVESEYYNFDALNLPPDHPAREAWDTFWIKQDAKKKLASKERLLLRTHTSPVQIRYMETHKPPFQIIVPGRVFRYEATDQTHEANFYQLEGLMVGKTVSLANFKYVIEEFFKKFFREKVDFRFRPSYFPFVEPGVEVDVKFRGKWLEMMGAGMVHPRVFEAAHYNPRDFQGFAFGGGIDRLAMIKYNVPDVRLFYSGDERFIKQF